MALNAICKRNHDLWRAKLPLICYYIVEWHLPNRVLCHAPRGNEPKITQVSPMVWTYVYYL
jgi:hypothetical protein